MMKLKLPRLLKIAAFPLTITKLIPLTITKDILIFETKYVYLNLKLAYPNFFEGQAALTTIGVLLNNV